MLPKGDLLERVFRIREKGSSVKTEIVAGLTTFVTMSYIIFLNPNILADAGIPKEAAIAATVYGSILGTLLMGLWGNFPVALAPGMGLNAFFAYYVCGTVGLPWTVALGAVFISGVIFFLLTVAHIREALCQAVPVSLRAAIVVGVGMFISFIGLKNAGIVVANDATFVTLGHVTQPVPLLACLGLVIMTCLMVRRVQAAILIGTLVITALAMILGVSKAPSGLDSIVSLQLPSLAPVLFKLDIMGALHYGIISIVLTFTIVELFDNMGALIGLLRRSGIMGDDGKTHHLGRALTIDSLSTIMSSFIGTSTVTTYAENASGIAQGGRTGLTAVVVAICFGLSLFFAPLVELVPACATAPALMLVGVLMMTDVANIDFHDLTEAVPAFLTILMMPLTYSIASGFGFGFISYVVIKICTGRARELHFYTLVIALLFSLNFIIRQ